MGNQLSDGEKVVVTVFVAVLAGGVAGLFFFGRAMLDMQQAIGDLNVSVAGLQRDVTDLREDIADLQEDVADLQEDVADLQEEMVAFRAEVSERFDAMELRLSAVENAIETHHGPLAGPASGSAN